MKKKILSICICAAFLATAVIGGTLAYFTDTEDATNTFTVGNVDITLDEAVVEFDDATDKYVAKNTRTEEGNTYANIFPGAVLPKDPTVHNVGTYDAYVKTDITVPNSALEALGVAKDEAGSFDAFKGVITGGIMDLTYTASPKTANGIADGLLSSDKNYLLVFDAGENSTVFTVYNLVPLASKTTDTAIFTQIKVKDGLDNEDLQKITDGTFEMSIVSSAIQAKGFVGKTAAADAFAALAKGATHFDK